MAYIDKVTVGGTTYDVQDARDVALQDGYYQNMTVGDAEQLVSTVGVEDKVPYNFRTSGGSADIGDREVDKLVGGTVAFNQIAHPIDSSNTWDAYSGAFTKSDGVGSFTNAVAYATAKCNLTLQLNHVYLIGCTAKVTSSSDRWDFGLGLNGTYSTKGAVTKIENIADTSWHRYGTVGKFTDADSNAGAVLFESLYSNSNIEFKEVIAVDLTQMFGSTIADYINTLETSHAGDGVAWFRSLFPAPYYAYNSGELMSVKTTAHNMTGLNQWDEEVRYGYWSVVDGTNASQSTAELCSKNIIPVVPSTTYYFTTSATNHKGDAIFYDADMNFIAGLNNYGNKQFTTPANCRYMHINLGGTYGATYKHDVCISIRWDGERDGEYEPYDLHTYALDDVELRGIPKLDANNALYYDGDTYESDGTVTRKVGIITYDGTEAGWGEHGSGRFYLNGLPTGMTESRTGAFAFAYQYTLLDSNASKGEYFYCGSSGIYVNPITEGETLAQFKTRLGNSPIHMIYLLATPTTESADSYQNPQVVNDWGTEEYVDSRTIPIPVGHETTYRPNLRAKLEMAPNSPNGDGDYIVRQSSGVNTYVQLTFPADELPAAPTTDGSYQLKCTVSSGTATYTWDAIT